MIPPLAIYPIFLVMLFWLLPTYLFFILPCALWWNSFYIPYRYFTRPDRKILDDKMAKFDREVEKMFPAG